VSGLGKGGLLEESVLDFEGELGNDGGGFDGELGVCDGGGADGLDGDDVEEFSSGVMIAGLLACEGCAAEGVFAAG